MTAMKSPAWTVWAGNSPMDHKEPEHFMTPPHTKPNDDEYATTLTPADLSAIGAIVSERVVLSMMDTQRMLARAEAANDSSSLREWLIRLIQRRHAKITKK